MKQGGLVCVCLLLIMMFCVPVFAQPSDKSVETILIDDFDKKDEMAWVWSVQASKAIHKGTDEDGNVVDEKDDKNYPRYGYVEGIPNSLKAMRDADADTPYVFGAQVKYDRKGDNWFEIFPSDSESGEVKEIPFKGRVTQLDMWVWGANYLYYLEVIIRDAEGTVHVIPAASLNYSGWKNIVVTIPSYIRQSSKLRSGPETMNFVGFRVRADPNEFADDFVIYFDQLRYTSSTMNTIYDGFELRKPDFSQGGND